MTIEDTIGSEGDMSFNEIKREKEISSIFQWTKFEIGRITSFAHGKKQQIIKETASKLEGKIPMDTIAMEIVIQLQGMVSPRLIHKCLDEKYKQKYRYENAKKQKITQGLAAKVPLDEQHQVSFLIHRATH